MQLKLSSLQSGRSAQSRADSTCFLVFPSQVQAGNELKFSAQPFCRTQSPKRGERLVGDYLSLLQECGVVVLAANNYVMFVRGCDWENFLSAARRYCQFAVAI